MADWSKDKTLPGSDRSINDINSSLGSQSQLKGASVKSNDFGGHHVTMYTSDNEQYSYDTDGSGNIVTGKSHFTDAAAKLLGKDPKTGKNKW